MKKASDKEHISKTFSSHGYEYVDHIGSGSFSSVYLCHCPKYNNQFAIKRILKEKFEAHECNALISLNHPHIIKLYLTFDDNDYHYLVMEYCTNGTFKKKGNLEYEKFVYYAKQILEALAFCHSNRIAHRDIKPDNIFLDQYDHIKLGDFGLAKQFESRTKIGEKCGSLMFSAPEILLKNSICPFKSDIWALGITFFYLASGKYPFPKDSREDLKRAIQMGQLDYSYVQLNPQIQSLIQKMTARNPNLRLSAEKLLQLPIFKGIQNRKISKTVSLFSYQYGLKIKTSSPSFTCPPQNSRKMTFHPEEENEQNNEENKNIKLYTMKSVSHFPKYQINQTHSHYFIKH